MVAFNNRMILCRQFIISVRFQCATRLDFTLALPVHFLRLQRHYSCIVFVVLVLYADKCSNNFSGRLPLGIEEYVAMMRL